MALLPGDDAPYVFESELPPDAAGRPVLDYVAGRFAYQDRETWRRRMEDGAILLDGRKMSDPEEPLPGKGRFAYVHGSYVEPDVPTDWRVLHLSEAWMSVSKPAGMPVHSTPRIFRQTLTWQVRRLFGDGWAPVHRLDRDTSGLVLFARGREALSRLSACFSQRRVEKTYLALVHGEPKGNFLIDGPLAKAGDLRIPMRMGVRDDGKEARTRILALGRDVQGRGTWVEARPLQGRLHQIRTHLEFAGFPIVGDLLYDGRGGNGFLAREAGASPEEVSVLAGSHRMWLHARDLSFPDVDSGMPTCLTCPLEGGDPPFL